MNMMPRVSVANTAAPAFRRWQIVFLLIVFAAVLAWRLPAAWTEGRFYDEEATVFLAYAWHFPWQDALLRSFGGYLNLPANLITVGLAAAVRSGLISLEIAPYGTMLIGLACQLVPVLLLLTGSAAFLADKRARIIAALLVVLAPGTEEVLLNVVHIQFHLALAAAIILVLDVPLGAKVRRLYLLLLSLAPLSGPGAILLLPFFFLRALLDQDRSRAAQALALGAGATVQMIFFYVPNPVRGAPLDSLVLAAGAFIRLVVLPLGGPIAAAMTSEAAVSTRSQGMLLPTIAFAAVLCFAALVWWASRRRDAATWLLAESLAVAVLSLGFGAATRMDRTAQFTLWAQAGPRYNYMPLVLLGLALLALASRHHSRARPLAWLLIAVMLVQSAVFYHSGVLETFRGGPSWAAEVRAWRKDPDHPLAVWPRPAAADLSANATRCARTFPREGLPAEPRYCEGGWTAGFYRRP
jgi:hypothetical protein